ncbi:MAG: isoprenylcysteine carboxylmethyltransferase family protein [Gemmatimonadetes bacterium]|nr:isoprenylcysteine carboxylmethyltransferase family protein [Gemmatimonadota bacterium]
MNLARYIVALLVIATLPSGLLFWFVVHPFIGFWRRQGPKITYTVVIAMLLAVGTVLVLARGVLLETEYGTNYVLVALAGVFYLIAAAIELQCRKHLKFRILVGMPELVPEPATGKLLTSGIYGRVRHPRYVSAFFGVVAVALFSNYLAAYVIAGAMVPALHALTFFEERELRDRFGEEYAAYSRRVPKFVPSWSGN